MNYYPHHIGDFNNATRHLSRVERSLYRDMLDMYYDTEQPLTADFNLLCRKLMARTEEEVTGVEQVLNEFFTKDERGWIHGRCEQVIAEYREQLEKKSAAGKASAEARAAAKAAKDSAQTHANKGSSTGAQHVFNECSTNQEPITNNQKPETTDKTKMPAARSEHYTDDFEQAWAMYPSRPGASKKEAFQAWCARLKAGVGVSVLLAGVRRYAAYVDAMKTEPQYIKQPKSFFGPGEHYLADWSPSPRASPGGLSKAGQVTANNAMKWLEDQGAS